MATGIDEVAAENGFATAAVGVAVDRRDHRHLTFELRHEGPLEEFVLRSPGLVAHAVSLLEVAASAEGALAGTGEHNAAYVLGLRSQATPQVERVEAHLRIDGVENVRTIERHEQHEVVDPLNLQRGVLRERIHAGSARF